MLPAVSRDQAIARIQQGLGWRSDKATEILLELRLKQAELEDGQTLPWWLVVHGFVNATAGQSILTIPTGWIRFVEDEDITVDGLKVRVIDYADLIQVRRDPSTGKDEVGVPRYLAIRSDGFAIAPIPTQTTRFDWSYYAHDADLSTVAATATNKWLTNAPQVLIGAAGTAMARDLDYQTSEQRFLTMYQAALGRMLVENEIRKSGNRQYAVGAAQ